MALADDVAVVAVGTVGLNGESADAARMTNIEGELADFETTLTGFALDDLADVDTTTTPPADGDTLVYDDASETWVPGEPVGALSEISDAGATVNTAPVTTLWANAGLSASEVSAGTVEMSVRFGSSGVQDLAARSDHTHTGHTATPYAYSASGTLSSGSRTLKSQGVTLSNGIDYEIEAEVRTCQRGNGGSSYYTLTVTIDGTATTSTTLQCVGGVPDRPVHSGFASISGTGTSKTISASITYSSGDPLTVDAGVLIIRLKPHR